MARRIRPIRGASRAVPWDTVVGHRRRMPGDIASKRSQEYRYQDHGEGDWATCDGSAFVSELPRRCRSCGEMKENRDPPNRIMARSVWRRINCSPDNPARRSRAGLVCPVALGSIAFALLAQNLWQKPNMELRFSG